MQQLLLGQRYELLFLKLGYREYMTTKLHLGQPQPELSPLQRNAVTQANFDLPNSNVSTKIGPIQFTHYENGQLMNTIAPFITRCKIDDIDGTVSYPSQWLTSTDVRTPYTINVKT